MKTVKVGSTIAMKNLTSQEYQAVKMENLTGEVTKETEKAYFVEFSTDFGTVKSWFPKSCCFEEEIKRDTVKVNHNVKVGQKCTHETYGEGTILDICSMIYEINFNGTTKKIFKNFAGLSF